MERRIMGRCADSSSKKEIQPGSLTFQAEQAVTAWLPRLDEPLRLSQAVTHIRSFSAPVKSAAFWLSQRQN